MRSTARCAAGSSTTGAASRGGSRTCSRRLGGSLRCRSPARRGRVRARLTPALPAGPPAAAVARPAAVLSGAAPSAAFTGARRDCQQGAARRSTDASFHSAQSNRRSNGFCDGSYPAGKGPTVAWIGSAAPATGGALRRGIAKAPAAPVPGRPTPSQGGPAPELLPTSSAFLVAEEAACAQFEAEVRPSSSSGCSYCDDEQAEGAPAFGAHEQVHLHSLAI